MSTRMSFASFTAYECSVENCRPSFLFPPQHKTAFHDSVLEEILEERVVSSRGRSNPRAVKKKMSTFPVRSRVKVAAKRQKPTVIILSEQYWG